MRCYDQECPNSDLHTDDEHHSCPIALFTWCGGACVQVHVLDVCPCAWHDDGVREHARTCLLVGRVPIDNNLGDEGMIAIGKGLEANNCLQSIGLGGEGTRESSGGGACHQRDRVLIFLDCVCRPRWGIDMQATR